MFLPEVVTTKVDAAGKASASDPIQREGGKAFRMVPLDGPATFPRVVDLGRAGKVTVADAGWVRADFDSLAIVPGPYLKGSAQAVGWFDAEQWLVQALDDSCEPDHAPLPAPTRAVDLIKTQTIFNVVNQAGAQQLPAVDMGQYTWLDVYLGMDGAASFDWQLGWAHNSGAPSPATDVRTIKLGAAGWSACKFHRDQLINGGDPLLIGATKQFIQGPAPSLLVPVLLNTAGFGAAVALYVIYRAGRG